MAIKVGGYHIELHHQLVDEFPKLFHYYIHSKKKGRMSVAPLKPPHGQLIFDPERVANYLADTFVSVFVSGIPAVPAQYQTHDVVMPDVVISYYCE